MHLDGILYPSARDGRFTEHENLRLVAVAGDADSELGVAGLGGEGDGAAVLLDDALHDAEAEAGAGSDGLGGVEGVEDVGLAFEWDAGAVVGDGDAEVVARFGAG